MISSTRLPFNEELFESVVNALVPKPSTELVERARKDLTREYIGIPPKRSIAPEDHPLMDDPEEMRVINDIVCEYLLQYEN